MKTVTLYAVKFKGRIVYGGFHRTLRAALADARDCSEDAQVVKGTWTEYEKFAVNLVRVATKARRRSRG